MKPPTSSKSKQLLLKFWFRLFWIISIFYTISQKLGNRGAINRDLPLKGKSFFSKVVASGKKCITTPYKVQYVQVTQDPKRYVPLKSITRKIPCNARKGVCRHRRKFLSTHDVRGKHIHRRTTQQKPNTGSVAITSCVDLTTNTEKFQLGAQGMNTSASQNTNQEINVAPSTSRGDLTKNNGGARFSSAHVLQTKIVARRTPFVKPNAVNTTTSTDGNMTFTTNTANMQREEPLVATTLESHDFDTGISTSSLDSTLGIGQDTPREDFDNQVPVSSGLIKDSLDPVLTVCNLPPVLITSNINLGANSGGSTPSYNQCVPSTPSHVPQPELHQQKTEMLAHHTLFLKHLTSENQDEVIVPTASTNDIAMKTDLRTIQHDTHPASTATIPRDNMDPVLTVCNLPTLLITSSMDKISDNQISTPQYSGMMPCLQAQETQIKPDNLNMEMEVLPHNVPYLEQAVGSTQTVKTTRQSSTTQYFQSIPRQEFQVSTGEFQEMKRNISLQNTQYLDPTMNVSHTVTSLGLKTETACSAPQYNLNMTDIQEQNSEKDKNLDSVVSTSYLQYLKPDVTAVQSLKTDNLERNKTLDYSTPQYKRNISLTEKLSQIVKRDLDSKLSFRRKQCLKTNIDVTESAVTTDKTYKKTYKTNKKDECGGSQNNRSMMQKKAAKRLTHIVKWNRAPRRKFLKRNTSGADISTTFNMDSKSQDEGNISRCNLSMPSLEADDAVEMSVETKVEQSSNTYYLKSQTPVVATIPTSEEDPTKAATAKTLQKRKKKKELTILGIIENDIFDLDTCNLDSNADTAQGTIIESDSQCPKKDAPVPSLPISEDVCDSFNDIFNEVQRTVIENVKQWPKEDASVLSIPSVEAEVEVVDNLDAISNDDQRSVLENEKRCSDTDNSVFLCPTSEANDKSLDGISKEVHKIVEDAKKCPIKDAPVLLNPTGRSVSKNLDVMSDKVHKNVVGNENQCSNKDTSVISIPTPETIEEQLDRIFNDENTSARNSTAKSSTHREISSTVALSNSGVNPVPSASELHIVLSTCNDDPVSDTEDSTPHFDTESEQSPVTCEGQDLKAESSQTDLLVKASVVKEANKTADKKKTAAVIENTLASPQPGTSQEVTPTSKSSNETSEQVIDSTGDKNQPSENNVGPSEEQADPKAASNLKCRFFRSPRGKRMLLVDGIRYRVNNISSDKIRWRCSSHERYGCKAKLHTIGNKIVYFVNEHVTFSPDEGVDDLEPYGIIDPETYY